MIERRLPKSRPGSGFFSISRSMHDREGSIRSVVPTLKRGSQRIDSDIVPVLCGAVLIKQQAGIRGAHELTENERREKDIATIGPDVWRRPGSKDLPSCVPSMDRRTPGNPAVACHVEGSKTLLIMRSPGDQCRHQATLFSGAIARAMNVVWSKPPTKQLPGVPP